MNFQIWEISKIELPTWYRPTQQLNLGIFWTTWPLCIQIPTRWMEKEAFEKVHCTGMNFWECNELLKFETLENTASDMILTGIAVEFMYFLDGLSTFYSNPHALNRERDESKVHCMKWTLELWNEYCNELWIFEKVIEFRRRRRNQATEVHSNIMPCLRRWNHGNPASQSPGMMELESSFQYAMNFWLMQWTFKIDNFSKQAIWACRIARAAAGTEYPSISTVSMLGMPSGLVDLLFGLCHAVGQ